MTLMLWKRHDSNIAYDRAVLSRVAKYARNIIIVQNQVKFSVEGTTIENMANKDFCVVQNDLPIVENMLYSAY